MRFEASCEWKKYKLKELSKIFDGTHQTPDYKDHGISFVSVEDIDDLYSTSKFITKDAFYRDFKIYPQKNDILMTRIGDIGTPALVTKEQPLAYYVSLALIKPTINLNSTFAKYMIESKSFQHELWKKTIHVAFPKKINKEEIGECLCFAPNIDSQRKIGLFLSLIDERIEAQNKIIEKYESLKIEIKECIYLLSKEKEPLEKILHEVSEKSTTQNQYPVLSSTVKGLFLQNEYFDRSIASDNNIGYKVVHKGQIIISPQNLWMGNLTFNEKYENGIVSPSYKIYDINQKYSKKYIYWLLTSKRSFFNYRLVSEQGASIVRRNLSIDAFMGLSIPVVKDRNCESKIEKLIDLIEKKLETEKKRESLLNQQKQFLLSNLFI